jgi:hypothetical protein
MLKSHAARFWIWFAVFLTAMLTGSLGNYLKTVFHPYDLGELQEEEVLSFKHNFGQTNLAVKLHTLEERRGTDILLLGSHMTRAMYDDRGSATHDVFNVVYGNLTVNGAHDFLRYLEGRDLLPRRAVVLTFLTHQDQAQNLDIGFDAFVDLPWTNPYQWAFRVPRMLEMEFVLSGHAALWSQPLVVNYDRCLSLLDGDTALPSSVTRGLRLTTGRFLPIMALVSSGLLSIDEICTEPQIFKDIDFNSLNRHGGYMALRQPPGLTLREPYPDPVRSERETADAISRFRDQIRALTDYGRQHGFEVIYLFPPRYEEPLNGPKDEVANRAFEELPDVPVADLRRFSLEPRFFYDDTHPAAPLNHVVFDCVDQILENTRSLERLPAVGGMGVTVC